MRIISAAVLLALVVGGASSGANERRGSGRRRRTTQTSGSASGPSRIVDGSRQVTLPPTNLNALARTEHETSRLRAFEGNWQLTADNYVYPRFRLSVHADGRFDMIALGDVEYRNAELWSVCHGRRTVKNRLPNDGTKSVDEYYKKQSLTAEKKEPVKDEKTLEEIAELKRAKADELRKFKREFEAGTVHNAEVGDSTSTAAASGAAMPAGGEHIGIDKKLLSEFKEKYEKFVDMTLDYADKSLEGVGKENLASMKEMFEKQSSGAAFAKPGAAATEEELLGLLQRSDADKKRLRAAFDQSVTAQPAEEPKDCCICRKIVYPVEKIVASKRVYHTGCFKCATCGKKLSPTTFNSHKGDLYCRPHMLEVLHPERAGTTGGGEGGVVEEDEEGEPIHVDEDEDDEYAVSSKPKHHGANVVRAGNSNIGDELSQLKSALKDKKQNWQQSVSEASGAHQKSSAPAAADEIATGRVKANLDRFISGAANVDGDENNNEEEEEKRRQLDAIRNQVSEVKNKWKTGDLEKAESHADRATDEELAQLKKGPGVKARFSERLEPASAVDGTDQSVVKSYDRSELDTSNASEARKSFLEGLAYQSGPVEKTSANELQDLKFEGLRSFKDKFEKGEEGQTSSREKAALELDIQLKAIKQALEKGTENMSDMSPEARAERKKQEIEAEFLRYKLARKIQAKRQADQAAAAGDQQGEDVSDVKEDIPTSAEVGSIKSRFEAGEAYKTDTTKTGVDVDIKMAGKAREKFKNIDAQNPGSAPTPKSKSESKPSKWDKKTESNAEVVNKRTVEDVESSDEDDNFDVKNLMNKFKNIESIAPNKVERKLDELEALRVEAKNLRQRFEKAAAGGGAADGDDEESEEKRRQLEEEFRQLKEERERAQKALDEERQAAAAAAAEEENVQKDDVQIAEGHGSKMAAKWEKIHKKEAKKAQKSQMPQKATKAADEN